MLHKVLIIATIDRCSVIIYAKMVNIKVCINLKRIVNYLVLANTQKYLDFKNINRVFTLMWIPR